MSQEVLPKTQMAVVVHGKGLPILWQSSYFHKHCPIVEDYRYEEVPVPEPGPNEVLVKVEAVGICAGDAKTYAGATRFWGQSASLKNPFIQDDLQVTEKASLATSSLRWLLVTSSLGAWWSSGRAPRKSTASSWGTSPYLSRSSPARLASRDNH